MSAPGSIEVYLEAFPPEVLSKLAEVRDAIRRAAPGCEEIISYGIPAFTLAGRYVVYFAGWKRHVSLYPVPDLDAELAQQLRPYRAGRGTLRFPLTEPIPVHLVERVVALLLERRMAAGR
jgi:uncharacterized protein YdhG (YjbR/CyaY superfamily)